MLRALVVLTVVLFVLAVWILWTRDDPPRDVRGRRHTLQPCEGCNSRTVIVHASKARPDARIWTCCRCGLTRLDVVRQGDRDVALEVA